MQDWRRRLESQLVFASETVQIGRVEVDADDPLFSAVLTPGHYTMAFPMTSVEIHAGDAEPFVTDRTLTTFYNPTDRYRRGLPAGHRREEARGDRCWWISLPEEDLERLVGKSRRRSEPLLAAPAAPCSDSAFLLQRLLVAWCQDPALATQERVGPATHQVARELLVHSLETAAPDASQSRWLTARALGLLRSTLRRKLSLEEMADRLGCSPYYICRLVRRQTGRTVVGYRTALRLRQGVDDLLHHRGRITDVALDLGFANHSHFTSNFRRTFGVTPSEFLGLADGSKPWDGT